MSRRTIKLAALGVVLVGIGALSTWIVRQRLDLVMYRQVPPGDSIPFVDDGRVESDTGVRPMPSIEIHRKANEYEYAISTVEFTDQGFFWDEKQLSTAANYLRRQIDAGRGAVIVVFAHGWNNNAAPDNQNAACFQEVLKAIGTLQASYHRGNLSATPAVVGVYLGWRGLVFRNVRLNQALTFWNRAKIADRIGSRGDLVETLLTLSKLRSRNKRGTKLIIVGHSFGARAIFSGINPLYNAAFVPPYADAPPSPASSSSNPIDDLADIVVLVNPAFSANQFIGLNRRLARWSSPPNAQPSLVVAGSTADQATRLLYPRAYMFSRWIESFAKGEDADALKITVGNYPAFMTDTIEMQSGAPRPPTTSVVGNHCRAMSAADLDIVRRSRIGNGGLAAAANYDTIKVFGNDTTGGAKAVQYEMVLKRFGPRRSVLAVAVDPRIIASHSEIFTAPFTEFLTRIVNAKAFWAGDSTPAPVRGSTRPAVR